MTQWSLTIPGRPTTKGNHQRHFRHGNRIITAPSAQAVKAQASVRSIAWAERPPELLLGPLELSAAFAFAIPKSGKNRKASPGDVRESKPDANNLLKLLQDALEGVVFVDDAQIVRLSATKVWGERDETRVMVRTL